MKIPRKFSTAKKSGLAAFVGLALAVSTAGGVALAAGADDWYDGDNASVADHDNLGVELKLYNASGTAVTSGSTTTPIAAFAAAAGTVRADDTYASLFVHLPQASTAPGAWPGVQVTGTSKFSGSGAVTAPASLAGKPYVATGADGYTLADVAAILPNNETAASFAGVYELRLRTSSPTDGVSTEYAVTYVKVTGSSWTITDAPVFGQVGDTATSVKATWPKKIKYGKAATVKITVNAASGSTKPTGKVRVVNGSKTVGSATLSGGKATVTLAKKSLKPGKYTLLVRYDGAAGSFTPSQSAAKTITVVKSKKK
ncbi:Ig-like domain repeat protein [Nocardioides sp. SR21]|uniref:Ig-like domain repeat protein n=1 Tax=Nocardioides sp. SR21 TaxID=2919501 RepID=UPI001FA97013|nr:Ig-like domain repeat protein [Nocardioides sp. SR21]